LALPAAVWAGAAYEELFVPCDLPYCDGGERSRAWFFAVVFTAPLIPLGVWRVSTGLTRPGLLAALMRLICLLGTAFFGLLGLAMLAFSTGLTEAGDEGTLFWLPGALWCLAVAALLLLVRRWLPRRYPSGSWPRSDRSTSAG
jgi:hypothetical protein